jgi:hypothetical protein
MEGALMFFPLLAVTSWWLSQFAYLHACEMDLYRNHLGWPR